MRKLLTAILLLIVVCVQGQETETEQQGFLARLLEKYNEVDTNYVDPPHYNFSAMLSTVYTYDIYQIKSNIIIFEDKSVITL